MARPCEQPQGKRRKQDTAENQSLGKVEHGPASAPELGCIESIKCSRGQRSMKRPSAQCIYSYPSRISPRQQPIRGKRLKLTTMLYDLAIQRESRNTPIGIGLYGE
jgi:hypothetical protein